MLWLHIEDSYYYQNKTELEKTLKDMNIKTDSYLLDMTNIVLTEKNIEEVVSRGEFDVPIISPYPPSHFKQETSFFGVVKVPNKFGLLTKSEHDTGMSEYQKLNNDLGLTVEESFLSFDDMAGSKDLRTIARKLLIKYSMGEVPKAVFLAGVPGTGKSFFAQCLAGETKRYLVSLNLTKLMYKENPIEAFDDIISYLQKENKKYLLWIDEIEKMFTSSEKSEHMKNKFLTFLNDLGLTIELDAFVVITANNVTNILEKNPEMVRGGRVETFAKVFMDFPEVETATTIFELYINKRNSIKEKKTRFSNLLISTINKNVNDDMWIVKDVKQLISSNESFFVQRDEEDIKKYILELSEEDETLLSKQIFNIFDKMTFTIKADDIAYTIDRTYPIVCNPNKKPENFPYVPAEIKEIVTQLYYLHLENELNQDNIEETLNHIMKTNIPIGEAGGLGIDKMKGNENKFSIIIK